MNLSKHNEWLWNSRWTHWWLKTVGPGTKYESCMEPTYSGTIDDDEIRRCVKAFKRANINTVLAEGLRHLIRFEHDGKTNQVIEAIRKATQACHRAGIRVIHHTTTSFAGHRLSEFPARCQKWLNIDARTGTHAFVKWTGDWVGGGWNYYVRELIGWCEALTDEYLQYAILVDADLTISRLRQFGLVILPNAACLSDAACRAIGEYVARGGNLILTHETGRRDETGALKAGSPMITENRLAGVLGIHPGAGTEGWSVQFGKHGLGKWVYFAHKPGLVVYTTANMLGERRTRDTADVPAVGPEEQELQRSLMIGAVRWATAGQLSLTIPQAPRGLLVKAFHQRHAVVVHLLNCRGESVKYGEVIPKDYPVRYPSLEEDIILELRRDSLKQAYLISPDWPGKEPIKIDPIDHGYRLTIPAHTLKRYEVLYAS